MYPKIVFAILVYFFCMSSFAQTKVVQISGLVLGGDSLYGIPGVQVSNHKIKRTVFTNYSGFFSLPTFEGDTLIFDMVGFKSKKFIVPLTKNNNTSLTVAITLYEDTLLYPVIEYFPYPTLKDFKKAFIALGDNKSMYQYHSNFMSANALKQIADGQPMSASQNNTIYLKNMVIANQNRNMIPTTDFVNPFAWSKFFKDMKKDKANKKKADAEKEYLISE